MTVGKNIKKLRTSLNLTQDQLAERINTTRQTISNYETGKSQPDIETLQTIATALDTDINSLIYGLQESEDKKSIKISFIQTFLILVAFLLIYFFAKSEVGIYYLASPYDSANNQIIIFILLPLICFFVSALLGTYFRTTSINKTITNKDKLTHKICLIVTVAICLINISMTLYYLYVTLNIDIDTPQLFSNMVLFFYLHNRIIEGITCVLFIALGLMYGYTQFLNPSILKKKWIILAITSLFAVFTIFRFNAPILRCKESKTYGAIYSSRVHDPIITEYTYTNGKWETINHHLLHTEYNSLEYFTIYYADNELWASNSTAFGYLSLDNMFAHSDQIQPKETAYDFAWKSSVWLSTNESLLAVSESSYINTSINDLKEIEEEGFTYITIRIDKYGYLKG